MWLNCCICLKCLPQNRGHILCWVKWKIPEHIFVGDIFCKRILNAYNLFCWVFLNSGQIHLVLLNSDN